MKNQVNNSSPASLEVLRQSAEAAMKVSMDQAAKIRNTQTEQGHTLAESKPFIPENMF